MPGCELLLKRTRVAPASFEESLHDSIETSSHTACSGPTHTDLPVEVFVAQWNEHAHERQT
jgi:hypothetical protein